MASSAAAQTPAAPAPAPAAPGAATEEQKAEALARYLEGVDLVTKAQWSDALAAFEASARVLPNEKTTLAIGSCERALGRYVRARATLARALEENAARGSKLPPSSVAEISGFITEIDRVIATARLTVEPQGSTIAVDGRPLAPLPTGSDGALRLAAGVSPPGPGQPTPARSFELVLDPGVHVFTLSRKGFADVVLNRTFGPGSATELELKLDELPARMKVTSSEAGAIVRVADTDVGPTPVEVLRPPGSYRVVVAKDGFIPYETEVRVKAGEAIELDAPMAIDEPSVLERWWFWAGAATVIAGGVVLTYALTRPEPEPPPYDGGTTGWVVQPSGVRF